MKLKGVYSSATSYNVGDVVKFTDDVVYHLQQPAKAGTPPTDSRYWGQLEKTLKEAVWLILDAIDMAEADADTAVKAMIENNLTTTAEGKILDARQGKALKELIDTTDGMFMKKSEAGWMALSGSAINVVEFNARFGDPETEAVLPRLGGDFAKVLLSCADGNPIYCKG